MGDWLLGEDEGRDLLMHPLEVNDIAQVSSPPIQPHQSVPVDVPHACPSYSLIQRVNLRFR
jgi:hypothetical protein